MSHRNMPKGHRSRWIITGGLACFIVLGITPRSSAQEGGKPATDKIRSRIEHEIDRALREAAKERKKLHDMLAGSSGVHRLLNQPASWKLQIKAARCALDKAKVLFSVWGQKLDPKLKQRYQELETKVKSDEADRRLAEELERIRLQRATIIGGKFDHNTAGLKYLQVFRRAGFSLDAQQYKQSAKKIRQSPIRMQLIAALDDWAFVAMAAKQKGLTEKLLSISRMADPDVLRDRIRDPKLWRIRPAQKKLIKELLNDSQAFAQQSPQMLNLVGALARQAESDELRWRRKAVLFNPRDFWLTFELGNALMPTNPQEAAGYYRAALAIRPECSAAWNNLGNSLVELKNLDESLTAYRKAIAIDPRNSNVWNSLGAALQKQKKLNEAIAAFKKAVTIDPNNAKAWNNFGNAFIAVGRFAEATLAFRKSLAIEPQSDQTWNNYGRLLQITGKLEEARAALEKSIALNPKNAEAWYNLGRVHKQTGNPQRAMDCFRRAVQIDPEFGPARKALGVGERRAVRPT